MCQVRQEAEEEANLKKKTIKSLFKDPLDPRVRLEPLPPIQTMKAAKPKKKKKKKTGYEA
jgi:hypothetical protein